MACIPQNQYNPLIHEIISVHDTEAGCNEDCGVCCLPDGTCVDNTQTECTNAGGSWNAGVTCADVICPSPSPSPSVPPSTSPSTPPSTPPSTSQEVCVTCTFYEGCAWNGFACDYIQTDILCIPYSDCASYPRLNELSNCSGSEGSCSPTGIVATEIGSECICSSPSPSPPSCTGTCSWDSDGSTWTQTSFCVDPNCPNCDQPDVPVSPPSRQATNCY